MTETTNEVKVISLPSLIIFSVFNFALSQIIIKIKSLEVILFQMAVSLKFSGLALAFVGPILSFCNFDLLSAFEEFQVPYDPPLMYSESISPNFGFIGYDSSSFLLNLQSLFWFIPAYLFYITCIFIIYKASEARKLCLPKKIL